MRALVIADVAPGDARAGTARVTWLVNGLAANGVEPHLLALRQPRVKRAAGAGDLSPSERITVVEARYRERSGFWRTVLGRGGGFTHAFQHSAPQQHATTEGLRTVDRVKPDVIVSTAPPMRICESAYQIASQSGLPWVSDLRDPAALGPLGIWITKGFYEAFREREREWMTAAALNVVTAPSCAKLLEDAYPGAAVETVTNGWTPGESPPVGTPQRGVLFYSGSTGGSGYGFAPRFPVSFSRRVRRTISFGRMCHTPFARRHTYVPLGLRALEAIARRGDDVAELKFRGNVSSDVATPLQSLGLGEKVRILPWAPPSAVLNDLATAHVVWLALSDVGDGTGEQVVASKVFSYLASGRPIFAVLPPRCDTANILRKHEGVFMPDPDDPAALADGLARALALPPATSFARDVDGYRRDVLATKMAGLVEHAAARGAARAP